MKITLVERVDDFLEEMTRSEAGWNEKQTVFTTFVERELTEQRQMCADAVYKRMQSNWAVPESLRSACLGATGESDDK